MYPSAGNSLLFIFPFQTGRCPFCLDSNLFLFPFQEFFWLYRIIISPLFDSYDEVKTKRKWGKLDCWVESLLFALGWSCHRDRSVDRASFDIKFPYSFIFRFKNLPIRFLVWRADLPSAVQSNPPLDCPLSLKRINFSFLSLSDALRESHLHNVSP